MKIRVVAAAKSNREINLIPLEIRKPGGGRNPKIDDVGRGSSIALMLLTEEDAELLASSA